VRKIFCIPRTGAQYLVAFAVLACATSQCARAISLDQEPREVRWEYLQERGYSPLFNGRDLTGWRNPYDHGEARAIAGEIHLRGNRKFFLVTEEAYSDFRLVGEIMLPEGPANSGLMFRCHAEPNKVYGYQAECDGSPRRWSGGLYDEGRRRWIWPSTSKSAEPFLRHAAAAKEFFARPAIAGALKRSDWNRYVVECRGDRIRIWVNDVQITDLRDSTDARGYIGLQHHGEAGQVYRFRNLFIKELPEVPAEKHVELVRQNPIAVTRLTHDTTLVDFGCVAFGNLELQVPDDARGKTTIHFGENLSGQRVDRNPPGTVRYQRVEIDLHGGELIAVIPPADERNTQQHAGSHPPAVLTPRSWGTVMPFRWVEIEGLTGQLQADQIFRRAAFAKGWDDHAADFESSDELLNQIWELCRYSIKATTFAGVYVDGDRERIPYEADAYLNQLSHYTTDHGVDMARRTFDWLMENGTWPTEWAPHMIFMAHADWMRTGDVRWLAPRYEALKKKTLQERVGPDGLVRSGIEHRTKEDIVDWPKGERDGYVFTEVNTVVNAFYLSAMRKMAVLALALGHNSDAEQFETQAARAQAEFQEQLFDEEQGLYRDGIETDHCSVHANLFPLAFGLVPHAERPGVVEWLKRQPMRCSVYAAQYLLEGLFEYGADEAAVALITADGDRSWQTMVERDATITWEAWGEEFKPNLDWNHAWGAAPANLLPRFVLGVRPLLPGWKRAVIRPCPGGLKSARGKVPTPAGPISVDWRSGAEFRLSLKLPPGMSARVELPAHDGSRGVFRAEVPVPAKQVGDRWILCDDVQNTAVLTVR
jgi:hypothetical protein